MQKTSVVFARRKTTDRKMSSKPIKIEYKLENIFLLHVKDSIKANKTPKEFDDLKKKKNQKKIYDTTKTIIISFQNYLKNFPFIENV